MAYDDTSFYGDLFCMNYDGENNPIHPPSPFGFFLYHIIGHTFDSMDDIVTDFMNNSNILYCDEKLINYYGRQYNIPNPFFNNRFLTPEEYRIYIYLKKCRLLTIEDLQVCFNNCMSFDEYEVKVTKVEPDILEVIDHLNYESNDDWTISNILANTEDDGADKITNHAEDENYDKLKGKFGHNYNLEVIVEIPENGWAQDFLDLLMTFISVKGNVKVQEYHL